MSIGLGLAPFPASLTSLLKSRCDVLIEVVLNGVLATVRFAFNAEYFGNYILT
jgi:hypothetical protein